MMRHSLIYVALFFILVSGARAATDTFTIGAAISADDTPPSVPTNLAAVPVSTSQIDLTWSASTDDSAVTGYYVFRDNTQIASVGSTSYSDTGLSENTLYTYFIQAYDAVLNTSSSSASVATTTLVAPITPTPTSTPPSGGSSGSYPYPKLIYLEVIPNTTSTYIVWRTENYARTTLRYGRTSSYELGTSVGQFFRTDHQTLLTNLEPNTEYQFMIEGENSVGMEAILTKKTFRTLEPVDVFAPGNVKNLQAVREGNDIRLTWDNPTEEDFSHVRVLGSDRFYPGDEVDGAFVYEGSGEIAIDGDTAIPNTVRFYTVFSYDDLGNISSGAIVAIRIDKDGVVHIYDPSDIPLAPDEYLLSLSLEDLRFEQDGKLLTFEDGAVSLDGSKQFSVYLPYDLLPEHLKSIVMTLKNAAGENFSFLLRANEDRTSYTASVAPLGTSGVFPFTASIFDFSVRKVAEIRGAVISEIVNLPENDFLTLMFKYGYLPYFLLLLMTLILIGMKLVRKGKASASVSAS